MRSVDLAIVTVLGIGMATPGSAANRIGNQAAWDRDQASDPQSFQSCVDLARQRGFAAGQDRNTHKQGGTSSVRRFVEGCMAGRQH